MINAVPINFLWNVRFIYIHSYPFGFKANLTEHYEKKSNEKSISPLDYQANNKIVNDHIYLNKNYIPKLLYNEYPTFEQNVRCGVD